MITAGQLRKRLDYNPKTGLFFWKSINGHRVKVGDQVGTKADYGRIVIWVDGRMYRAHRLAWLYMYGKWPSKDVDHINGNPSDNRISNLRLATKSQNLGNMKKPITNTSGKKGVSWHAIGKKWQAHIRVEGKNYYLGLFPSVEAAHEAYSHAAHMHRGEFARTE